MSRVYLETSFFSVCVTTRTDGESVFRKEESRAWWTQQRRHHELLISAEVVRELSSPVFVERDSALAMTVETKLAPVTADVAGLAALLVSEKAMPGPAGAGDALHVAAAAVHKADFLLSWNVKHLANANKQRHLQVICLRAGLIAPRIVTPDQLWREADLPE